MRAFPVYLLMAGSDSVARNTMYVLLPAYYVLVVHMNPLQLVLVGTALEASYFLFQMPTGLFADTHSRRLAMIAGLFLTGLCFIVEGLVPLFSAIIAAEIVRGIGEAFFDGADTAWLADELGQNRYGQAMVRGSQVAQAGGILGVLLSVTLGSIHLNLPVVCGGGAIVGLSLFLWVAMPEEGFKAASRAGVSRLRAMRATLGTGVRTVRGQPVLLAILAVELFAGAASEGFDRLWEAHLLRDIHLPHIGTLQPIAWFGIIAIGSSVVGILTSQALRPRLDAITRTSTTTARALFILEAVYISTIVVFALAGNLALALVALGVNTALRTVGGPVQSIWLNQSIRNPQVRATIFSMRGSANAIGQTAGGPPIGVVGNVVSLRAAIAATSLILLPILLIWGWVMRLQGEETVAEERPAMAGAEANVV